MNRIEKFLIIAVSGMFLLGCEKEVINLTTNNKYKEIPYSIEIPLNWKFQKNDNKQYGDILSISRGGDIHYQDWNPNQIDIGRSPIDSMEREKNRLMTDDLIKWESTIVDGRHADLAVFPLENGKVTKGGTGGRRYFIFDKGTGNTGIIINKQGLGNPEFEAAFQRILETFDVDEFLEK